MSGPRGLSAPAAREPLHTREITLRGFRRGDGLFDVEAELIDRKAYDFPNHDRGGIRAGEALHHMQARITVSDRLRVVEAEAATLSGPYTVCPGGAANFGRIAGLSIRAGFMKEAQARMAGAEGCTHLRELVAQMATVAVQTVLPLRAKGPDGAPGSESLIGSCHAYATDGPVVQRQWPDRYTGP